MSGEESMILTFFSGQGPWALLFVALFLWELRESKSRESRLMELVDKLSDKYDEMADDLKAIKNKLWG